MDTTMFDTSQFFLGRRLWRANLASVLSLTLLFAVTTLSGCAYSEKRKAITGKWYIEEPLDSGDGDVLTELVNLRKDGTWETWYFQGKSTVRSAAPLDQGRWRFNGRFRMKPDGDIITEDGSRGWYGWTEYPVVIVSKNTLILRNEYDDLTLARYRGHLDHWIEIYQSIIDFEP